jgi:hypothetical protein
MLFLLPPLVLSGQRARGFVVAGFDNRRLPGITIVSNIELELQFTIPRDTFALFA